MFGTLCFFMETLCFNLRSAETESLKGAAHLLSLVRRWFHLKALLFQYVFTSEHISVL